MLTRRLLHPSTLPLLRHHGHKVALGSRPSSSSSEHQKPNMNSVRSFNQFKSGLAIEKLYPQSTLDIAKSPPSPQNTEESFSGFIPMDKVQINYSRSGGPGGQNVNKVETKVDVRFHLDSADWIPEIIRNNMKIKFKNELTKDGFFFIVSDRTRSQHMNLADALEKIRERIRSCEPVAVAAPKPETLEKLRRLREKSARERLRQKRERHEVKTSRQATSFGE